MDKPYYIRRFIPSDLSELAENMRQSDIDELKASHGEQADIRGILVKAAELSCICNTWLDADNQVMAMFGLAPHPTEKGMGIPWVLATGKVMHFPKTFIKEGLRILASMQKISPYLINYVDVRNTSSIRYIQRLGFQLHPPRPFGVQGRLFHPFDLQAKGMREDKFRRYIGM